MEVQEAQGTSGIWGFFLIFIFIIIILVPTIIAFKKKHNFKVPIIIINMVSLLLWTLTFILAVRAEMEVGDASEDTKILLGVTASFIWTGLFVWCFITPKNKE